MLTAVALKKPNALDVVVHVSFEELNADYANKFKDYAHLHLDKIPADKFVETLKI